jgi:hypothetical protein
MCVDSGFVMTPSDEIVRSEELKIEQFMALGLGRYEAIRAVEEATDWERVASLLKAGYPLSVALKPAR